MIVLKMRFYFDFRTFKDILFSLIETRDNHNLQRYDRKNYL